MGKPKGQKVDSLWATSSDGRQASSTWPLAISAREPHMQCEPARRAEMGVRQDQSAETQLFSDPGKKGNPSWGRPFSVGQSPKKRGKQGATELRRWGYVVLTNLQSFESKDLPGAGLVGASSDFCLLNSRAQWWGSQAISTVRHVSSCGCGCQKIG